MRRGRRRRRGLYYNGPGYKTAGYKAGKTARAGPPRFAIRLLSFSASHERADLNDHRMLASPGFYRPTKPLSLPPSSPSFDRTYVPLLLESIQGSVQLTLWNSDIPFFFYRNQPSSASFFCSLLSPRIACQFFIRSEKE